MSFNILDEDEAVIMKDHNVSAKGASVTLILTNRSIIQINRNIWGKTKMLKNTPFLT